jgi:hypothetical protein
MQDAKTRRYPRTKPPADLLVAWQTGARKSVSRVDSICLGGLFVRTPHPPPESSVLQILLDWRTGEARARCVVRRVEPRRGMAIEIVGMEPSDRIRLAGFLRQTPVHAH